jgi:hypothetical protein
MQGTRQPLPLSEGKSAPPVLGTGRLELLK